MSYGIGGSAVMEMEDSISVMYSYYCYNLNIERSRNPDAIHDGTILIEKATFVEPEIREKIKRFPHGKKKVITKRVKREVDLMTLLEGDKILIENSAFAWKYYKGIDILAIRLTEEIFSEYQITGTLPKWAGYIK